MTEILEFTPTQYQELAAATATETASVRGASISGFGNQGIKFLNEVVQAAKQEFYFANFVKEIMAEPGTSQVSIPLKSIQLNNADMTWNTTGGESGGSGVGTGPYANTVADISFTTYNPLTSVTATILAHGAGFALRNFDMFRNVVNLLQEARDDLGYAIGTRIDITLAQEFGTADGLTFAQSGTRGAIQLYGGTATADSGLVTGDVITTDLVADAARYLKGTENWYRDGVSGLSGTLTLDTTVRKNGWMPTTDEPFVLFIGVAQEASFRKDSQFVNAAEYGNREIVQNGEIGKISYLGVRILVTNHVESFAAGATGPDNTTVAAGLAGGMTRCILMKAKKSAALVWGKQPELKVVDWAISDQVLIIVWSYYDIVVLHSDAVVCIDVANS